MAERGRDRSRARVAIRAENPADVTAVFAVQAEAFPSPAEARLVDRLRASARPLVSRVALLGEQIVGHVMVSPVTIEAGPRAARACGGLAPLGVLPAYQGRGIGAALVRAALAEARAVWPAVFLLGSPAYYGRFGFEPAAPHGFEYDGGAHGPAFQVHRFAPGALDGLGGRVRYHEAFSTLP